jgi:hypothetical protein
MALQKGNPLLRNAPEVEELAESIMSLGVLPEEAEVDALHIAWVAHHEIDYLLTWNCKHIVNAKILPRIYDLYRPARRVYPCGLYCRRTAGR